MDRSAPGNRKAQLIAAWCGPLLTVLVVIGLIPLAGFLPPPDPSDTAREIAAKYNDNLDGIRVGLVFSLVAMGLIVPWGCAVAAQLRRTEGEVPILAYIQIASAACGAIFAALCIVVWATAAFRPDELEPGTTRMLNDMGWILFVFTWPPFSIWCTTIAIAVFADRSERPVFPRWAAYLCLWCAVLFIPGSLIIFFKTGAFAYNGLIGLFVPFTAFFIWLMTMTVLTIRAINAQTAATEETHRLVPS